jgi:hypothetical protein
MRLSPVDHVFTGQGAYPINFLFFFKEKIAAEKLKDSLEKTLALFTPAASRLVEENKTLFFKEEVRYGWNFQKALKSPDMSKLSEMGSLLKSSKSVVNENLLEVTLTHFDEGSSLGVSLSHCVVDGYSYFMFLGAWSKLFRGLETYKPDLDREKLVVMAKNTYSLDEEGLFDATGFSFSPHERPGDESEVKWEVINYTEETLKKLYSEVSAQSGSRLSLNDVLCADLWKKLVLKYQKKDQELTFSCAFDYRRVLKNIGPLYFGNAVRGASFKLSYEDVVKTSIAGIAEKIGTTVRGINEEKTVDSLGTLENLRKEMGLSSMTRFHVAHPELGFLMTNLSRLPLLEIDFGAGTPVDFRILTPAKRSAVILPLSAGLRVQIAH